MSRLLDEQLVGQFFGVGSVGETNPEIPLEYIRPLAVPYWYQIPSIHEEDMIRQFGYVIEGFEDEDTFVVDVDMYVYREILEDDEPIVIDEEHAHGLYQLLNAGPYTHFKTQQTAPSTMAFSIRGSDGKQLVSQQMIRFFSALMRRFALGQLELLEKVCDNIILCQDDPAFGFVVAMVQREEAGGLTIDKLVHAIEEVFPQGAIPAYHYCEDWRALTVDGKHLLWDTMPKLAHIDVVSYPADIDNEQAEKINAFIERGGALVLGVLPNTDDGFKTSMEDTFVKNLHETVEKFTRAGVSIDLLGDNAMFSTQCGLSRASPELTREIHVMSSKFAREFRRVIERTT